LQGHCKKGDTCNFQHIKPTEKPKESPNEKVHNKQHTSDLKDNGNDEESGVCKFFLQGNCKKGDTCNFQHIKPTEKPKESPNEKVHNKQNTSNSDEKQVCRHFLRGNCKNGESCPFLHEKPTSNVISSESGINLELVEDEGNNTRNPKSDRGRGNNNRGKK